MFPKDHNPGRSMPVFEANLMPSEQMTILTGPLHPHISGQNATTIPCRSVCAHRYSFDVIKLWHQIKINYTVHGRRLCNAELPGHLDVKTVSLYLSESSDWLILHRCKFQWNGTHVSVVFHKKQHFMSNTCSCEISRNKFVTIIKQSFKRDIQSLAFSVLHI